MKKILIIAIIIVALIVTLYLTDLPINPFQKTSLQTRTTEEIKTVPMAQFRGSSYTYKTLFPYDFIYGDPNWGSILFKNSKFLSKEDKLNREFYLQCREIGIDLNRDNHFFVITTTVKAGLNLKKYMENPINFVNEVNKLIILKEPKSEILNIEIDDSPSSEDYPDINITPSQWQKLTTLLLPMITSKVINRGLLDSASQTNKLFLEELFSSIGWEKIEFK